MTNKEIEKRFLFDLNIGIFPTYKYMHYRKDKEFIVFIEDKPCRYNTLKKVIKILRKNGYRFDKYDRISFKHISYNNIVSIQIDIDEKIIERNIYNLDSYIYAIIKYSKIPDYIRKYKLK